MTQYIKNIIITKKYKRIDGKRRLKLIRELTVGASQGYNKRYSFPSGNDEKSRLTNRLRQRYVTAKERLLF